MFKYGGIKYTSEKKIVGFLHADKAVDNLKAAGIKSIKIGGMDGHGLVHIYFNDPAILDKLKRVNEVNEMTTGTFYDGFSTKPVKESKSGFFAGVGNKINNHNKNLFKKKADGEVSNKDLKKEIKRARLQQELKKVNLTKVSNKDLKKEIKRARLQQELKKVNPTKVSKIYKIAGSTVAEHRRRIIAREEYKAKKVELKVAQFQSKQQLPFRTKTPYRGLSDSGLKIKKKKSKGGFF